MATLPGATEKSVEKDFEDDSLTQSERNTCNHGDIVRSEIFVSTVTLIIFLELTFDFIVCMVQRIWCFQTTG